MGDMKEYRATFQIRYRDEPHPAGDWVSPDGWLSVFTDDPSKVRPLIEAVVGHLDNDQDKPVNYAFFYEEGHVFWPTLDVYKKGCLATVRFEAWGAP